MHEMSIMQSLLKILEQKASEKKAIRIRTITVGLGYFSGVEPDLLKSAFEWLSDGTLAEKAEFEINIKNFSANCKKCGAFELSPDRTQFKCPDCGSEDINIDANDELVIEKMEVDVAN
jgi:hydrogenase nickel incorporation protein HypA/HybF